MDLTAQNNWHKRDVFEVLSALGSGQNGLSEQEARERLLKQGRNVIPEIKPPGIFLIFLRQFQSPLIYILLAASLVVFLMGEAVDSLIIAFVLLFNAGMGTVQEGKSQNTLAALKKFTETGAVVVRGGEEMIVPDSEVVDGDVLILREGDKIPADARIIFSSSLKVDEASITGESEPVYKTADIMAGNSGHVVVADRMNMVFKGSHVVSGGGKAVVTATGLKTVIGGISKKIIGIDSEMPLKKNIRYLSRAIIIAVALISGLIFWGGVSMGKAAGEMFAVVVSLSVSIIPEGLPVVITLVLATGVWRMAKSNALVKRLQAVEALGQAKVIAVDKTGTITKNEMAVQKFFIAGKFFEVGGSGYVPKGEIKENGAAIEPLNHKEIILAGKIAAFCANARIKYSKEKKEWSAIGDPTEAALFVFSEKVGFSKEKIEKESPLVSEIPFNFENKYHATLHGNVEGSGFLTVVGAPETVVSLSGEIFDGQNFTRLNAEEKEKMENVVAEMSREGLRVLAFAVKKIPEKKLEQEDIADVCLVGFFGIKDTLRLEAVESIKKAKDAGIKVIMITGDHKITAAAIAREAGIYKEGDAVMTGRQIDEIDEKEFLGQLNSVSVFARVTPDHKLKIINAYKKQGDIIAMTGDGVNDAPSLVAADLGVAMGKIGTEVAKEASDIVLLDDNLSSVVAAIEEGRSIYKTIKKVTLYLFSTSLGEVLTVAGALFFGLPLPILASQIIWLNFVTDGFLVVALAMEPKESKLLNGGFKKPGKLIVDFLMLQRMAVMALPMALGALVLFLMHLGDGMDKARTAALTALAVFQWFNAWNCRSEKESVFGKGILGNKILIALTFVVIFLQGLAVYNPFMRKILHTVPLDLGDWMLIAATAFAIIIVEEVRKLIHRKISAI
ncbi:MAG: HAD-IC family P-type ATPase [Candidatus Pacebacteria bacterium]|nr:HAD-IC family P-type ATPase [Candidatus Paceibacterota bacterium]